MNVKIGNGSYIDVEKKKRNIVMHTTRSNKVIQNGFYTHLLCENLRSVRYLLKKTLHLHFQLLHAL